MASNCKRLGLKTKWFWSNHANCCRYLSSNSRFNTDVKNYYTILKITPNATQEQIKQAYYKLSKIYHPDTNHSEKAHDNFTAINEAYNVLGSLDNRKRYDRGLTVHHTPTRASTSYKSTQTQQFHGKRIVYDFDDWTQKYYDEARKRRKRHEAHQKQFERRHTSKETEIFNRNIIVAAVLTLIGVVVMVNGKKQYIL